MSCYSGSVEACLVSNVIEGADDEEPFVEARTDWRDPKEYTRPTRQTPSPEDAHAANTPNRPLSWSNSEKQRCKLGFRWGRAVQRIPISKPLNEKLGNPNEK